MKIQGNMMNRNSFIVSTNLVSIIVVHLIYKSLAHTDFS